MDSAENLYDKVREHYSAASSGTSVKYSEAVAKSFGYSADELANIPQAANLGLSCGNPLAIATDIDFLSLCFVCFQGETVVDFGCGAGFDVFLASKKVAPSGRAIGIDMNEDMLARANQILASSRTSDGGDNGNVTFLKANITSVPLPDGTADCVISNCVVNLVPHADKPAVFAEMYRLLRPGARARVALSDILAKRPLPERLRADLAMYVGCIAGAAQVAEYQAWMEAAGFRDVAIVDTGADVNVYLETDQDGKRKTAESCCAQAPAAAARACCGAGSETAPAPGTSACAVAGSGCSVPAGVVPGKTDLNEFVGSYKIFAIKK
ncbi:S-adenosyl-L-methionine-dependent methyltransferase [Thermothelomyces heterothallicus CBS 202.75]|uniref:S-adenosyl-L-methionine-dependent methyltransferase n=1 Tax=Thermothelomyces heterothallicus CBS 202.75 TaxID=1149848 RepID=UPI0037430528